MRKIRFEEWMTKYCTKLTLKIYDHKWLSLLICLYIIGTLCLPLMHLNFDMSNEAMLSKDDAALKSYNDFKEQFGRDDVIVIGVDLPQGITRESLNSIIDLHKALETDVPYVYKVTSLYNASYMYYADGKLYADALLKDWPDIPWSETQFSDIILSNPAYKNVLLSEDKQLTAILVEMDASYTSPKATQAHNEEAVKAIREILDQRSDIKTYLTGSPVVLEAFNSATMKDMIMCASACIAIIMLILIFYYRRLSAVFLPILVVEVSVLCAAGLMAWTHTAYTLTMNALIPLLLGVGTLEAVHVLAVFYRHYEESGDKREAIAFALGHSAPVILLTALTTSVGLFSFVFAKLPSIAELGIFAGIAVILALMFTFILLPILIAIFPMKRKSSGYRPSVKMDKVLRGIAGFSVKRAKLVLAVSLALTVVSVVFLTQLQYSHDVISYFDEDAPVRADLQHIDNGLGGSSSLELVIDTGKPGGLCEPEMLAKLEQLEYQLEGNDLNGLTVSKTFSVLDIIKGTNMVLNGNNPEFYQIPRSKETIEQELLLYKNSGSDDLAKFTDQDYQKAHITLKMPYADSVIYKKAAEELKTITEQTLGPDVSVTITGVTALTASIIPRILQSMSQSYISAFAMITLLMVLMAGNLRLGIASMLPNLLPIMLTFALMSMLHIPLDMTTMMIGSIALGIVVDDTLHFIYNYRVNYKKLGKHYQAVEQVMLVTGRAMYITSFLVIASFMTDAFASLSNVQRFGVFISLTVFLALLADFIITPATITVLTARQHRKKRRAGAVPAQGE